MLNLPQTHPAQIEFAALLAKGSIQSASLRTVFAPIWAVWGVTLVLLCLKHPRERVREGGV